MATYINMKSGASYNVEEDVPTVTGSVNSTLKRNEKFVMFTGTDGKQVAIQAAEVKSIEGA